MVLQFVDVARREAFYKPKTWKLSAMLESILTKMQIANSHKQDVIGEIFKLKIRNFFLLKWKKKLMMKISSNGITNF